MADLTDERRAALLQYCHLEEFASDDAVVATVDGLYDAAIEYMTDAGITRVTANQNRYDLLVNSLVLQWYDPMRRAGDESESDDRMKEPPGFRRLMNQLKLSAMVSELDTTTETDTTTEGSV